MCSQSLVDHTQKELRIGLMGIPPDFVLTSKGTIEGVNVRMISMMAERLKFTPKIELAASFQKAHTQVGKLHTRMCTLFRKKDGFSRCRLANEKLIYPLSNSPITLIITREMTIWVQLDH